MHKLGLVVALALATGCGSTVPVGGTVAGPASNQQGLAPGAQVQAGTSGGLGAAPGSAQNPAGSNLGSAPGQAPVGGGGSTSPEIGSAPSGGPALSSKVPGVTATTISFGVAYTQSSSEGNAAFGAGNQDFGDVRNYYNILIKDVNNHGGILGRKLTPVYFNLDTAGADTTQAQLQQECEYFTQDHPVFAIFGDPDDLMHACAQKAGALHLANGGNSTTSTFQRFPNYIEINPRLERIARATIDGLATTDYFKRGRNAATASKPVMGIITWDAPSYRGTLEQSYVPALRQRGMSLTSKALVAVPYANEDLTSMSAAISNAVLKFRQDGVTHVIIQDGPAGGCAGSCLTLLWLKNASSQGYFPRYGFNDSNSAKGGYDAGMWNAVDVDDSRYVTWADRDEYADSGVGVNKTRERCLGLLREGGINPDNESAKTLAFQACNVTWLLRAGLQSGPGQVDVAAMTAGVNRLGSSFASACHYGMRFSATQHDGTAAFRLQGFNNNAWSWLGRVQPMA